jgi:hypothetical protein
MRVSQVEAAAKHICRGVYVPAGCQRAAGYGNGRNAAVRLCLTPGDSKRLRLAFKRGVPALRHIHSALYAAPLAPHDKLAAGYIDHTGAYFRAGAVFQRFHDSQRPV